MGDLREQPRQDLAMEVRAGSAANEDRSGVHPRRIGW